MPVYFYKCSKCGQSDRRLLTVQDARTQQTCRKTPGCLGVLRRETNPPSVVAKEVIDNGIMVRRVERDIDIKDLLSKRSKKDYRNRD